jgi:hypothetical protein
MGLIATAKMAAMFAFTKSPSTSRNCYHSNSANLSYCTTANVAPRSPYQRYRCHQESLLSNQQSRCCRVVCPPGENQPREGMYTHGSEVECISLGRSPLPNFVRTTEDLQEVQKPHHVGNTQVAEEVAITTMSRDCWWQTNLPVHNHRWRNLATPLARCACGNTEAVAPAHLPPFGASVPGGHQTNAAPDPPWLIGKMNPLATWSDRQGGK